MYVTRAVDTKPNEGGTKTTLRPSVEQLRVDSYKGFGGDGGMLPVSRHGQQIMLYSAPLVHRSASAPLAHRSEILNNLEKLRLRHNIKHAATNDSDTTLFCGIEMPVLVS